MDAIARPLVISHRTNMGTMPENTLAGIDAAIEDGVDAIEIDVRATRDGVAVLLHDADLERVAGDPRDATTLTLDELREVRLLPKPDGAERQPIPTLEEALARVAGRAILVVEIKQRGVEGAVAQAIRAAKAAEWCWIWSFDPTIGRTCRALIPEVPFGLNVAPGSLIRLGESGNAIETCVRGGFAAISLHHPLVSAASVRDAHRRGLAVYTWTVDREPDIERVWRAGVDGICGNMPPVIDAVIGRTPGETSW